MKKLLIIVLVVAMVFAIGTTAYAEGFSNNTASTKIQVDVSTENLSATIPLNVTISAPAAGGACSVPENYKIVNTSAMAIKVSNISVSDKADGLTFSNTEISGTDAANNDKVSISLTPAGGTAVQLNATTPVTAGLGGFDLSADAEKAITLTAKCGRLTGGSATYADEFVIAYTIAAGTTE